jgi:hypothetical protein
VGKIIATSVSAWAMSIGTFVTLYSDGVYRIAATGFVPPTIDPETETFVADSVLRRLATGDGHFQRRGATCSPAALATLIRKGSPEGKRPAYVMSLRETLEHPVFGKSLHGVTYNKVIAQYED